MSLAPTASPASAATVIAVPSAIRKVEATPGPEDPLRSAKTSTTSAPEQGRMPTEITAAAAPERPGRSSACGCGVMVAGAGVAVGAVVVRVPS